MAQEIVLKTDLDGLLPLLARGKVREVYQVDEKKLLFVATDRVSAYDVVLKNGIPHKGALLTVMSVHWFSYLSKQVRGLKTHFISLDLPPQVSSNAEVASMLRQRSMQVRKLEVLPIESIVRGYITGSAWSEYQKKGTVHGIQMPEGLKESEKLRQPIWTPSTKAEQGEKDENISPERAAEIIGAGYAEEMGRLSLDIYSKARDYAAARGIIIADTKLEFAKDPESGGIILVDEVLTPDSSRFWPAKEYQVGKAQRSLDKQYLRDWLTETKLKGVKDVEIPEDVVQKTSDGYREAFEKLVGVRWDVVVGDDEITTQETVTAT